MTVIFFKNSYRAVLSNNLLNENFYFNNKYFWHNNIINTRRFYLIIHISQRNFSFKQFCLKAIKYYEAQDRCLFQAATRLICVSVIKCWVIVCIENQLSQESHFYVTSCEFLTIELVALPSRPSHFTANYKQADSEISQLVSYSSEWQRHNEPYRESNTVCETSKASKSAEMWVLTEHAIWLSRHIASTSGEKEGGK